MWKSDIRRDPGVFDDLADWWRGCPGPRAFPYLRHDWFSLWQECFMPRGAGPEVTLWKRDGELMAALPAWRRGVRRASLSNAHSEVFDLVSHDAAEAAPHVVDTLRRRPMMRLFRLDAASTLLGSASRQWFVDREIESLFVRLGTDPEQTMSGFSRNLRSNLRRNERKIGELGEVVFLADADAGFDDALDRCLALEAAGWKGSNGTAILSRPDTTRFYRGLADLARANGWLRLSVLLVAEKIVAFEFGLDYAGSRFWLKSGYDEEIGGAPGLVLKWHVIQDAIQRGLRTYELGGEAEDWKRQWANDSHRRLNVVALGDRGPNGLLSPVLGRWVERRGGERLGAVPQ